MLCFLANCLLELLVVVATYFPKCKITLTLSEQKELGFHTYDRDTWAVLSFSFLLHFCPLHSRRLYNLLLVYVVHILQITNLPNLLNIFMVGFEMVSEIFFVFEHFIAVFTLKGVIVLKLVK